MDDLQQRIVEIALQIPGYVGYQAKERRRDMDKHTRLQLAAKYREQDTHLARVARRAPIEYSNGLDNLDQKLERLIARFNTAPRGYAGWFDAAQIVEADLDALTKFDAALAGGVKKLGSALTQIESAVKEKERVNEAVEACADLLDQLNAQFDQREVLLAAGKKPSLDIFENLPSPLDALKTKAAPPADLTTLANLKMRDAISYSDIDYVVSAKITYSAAGNSFSAFMLSDRDQQKWLRVGPNEEITVCDEIELSIPTPPPKTIDHAKTKFILGESGSAIVTVEGAGGTRRGSVDYARYAAGEERLWAENFGKETRVMLGRTIDAFELKVYKR